LEELEIERARLSVSEAEERDGAVCFGLDHGSASWGVVQRDIFSSRINRCQFGDERELNLHSRR
jgi:hypothetical protein